MLIAVPVAELSKRRNVEPVCAAQAALAALRLANAATGEQQMLHALALQGFIPAVGAFTDRCLRAPCLQQHHYHSEDSGRHPSRPCMLL